MTTPYHTSSYKARKNMHIFPAGTPCIELTEHQLTAIFPPPTGKRGRPISPARHVDTTVLYHYTGTPTDASGHPLGPCRTVIFTRKGSPVADATITHLQPGHGITFPRNTTRIHFCAPLQH